MRETWIVEELRGSAWIEVARFNDHDVATARLLTLDANDHTPRRIVRDGRTVLWGQWTSRHGTSTEEVAPFWIVVSIDKPGPVERDGSEYFRHESFDAARDEARRLSRSCLGGRFVVMGSTFVTGWIETTIDAEIPF